MTDQPTARDVARQYSEAAAWVPVGRQLPPAGETVEVLYADGVVAQAAFAGRLPIMTDGGYRYVEPAFWRPA